MAKRLIQLSAAIDRVLTGVVVAFLAILVLVVLLQVFARYGLSSPPAWTEEAARYAMIWAGLLGATMSFKRRFDPALFTGGTGGSPVITRLSAIVRSLAVLLYFAPILLFCLVGADGRLERGFLYRHTHLMADMLPFPTIFVAMAVPLMIIAILVHLAAGWVGAVPLAAPPIEDE